MHAHCIHRIHRPFRGLGAALLAICAVGLLFSLASHRPTLAQVTFATNTPVPPDPLAVRPTADFDRYALRLWRERDLVEVLIRQAERLNAGEAEQALAIQLTQYELEQRFPGAPTQADQRERLLAELLRAPIGSADLRSAARPTLIDRLNAESAVQALPAEAAALDLRLGEFAVALRPFNLDGNAPMDVMIQARYPAEAGEVRYEDTFLLLRSADGRLSLPANSDLLPASPFGQRSVALGRAGDLNQDSRDELAVLVSTKADINQEMILVGWRGDGLLSLIVPGERLVFGRLVDWPLGGTSIRVAHYRVESDSWGCLSGLEITWDWSLNFFRPTPGEAYLPLDSVGCALHALEPIFARPPLEAIDAINALLLQAEAGAPGTERARLVLAMLHLLAGQPDQAQAQIDVVRPLIGLDAWVTGQAEAFLNVSGRADTRPIDVCAGLMAERADAACEVDQVLLRLFSETPLRRDLPLLEQFELLGLVVDDVQTQTEVGRLDRDIVHFNLTGASWWMFTPGMDGFYQPTPTESPLPIIPATPVLVELDAPPSAYAALFSDGDPQAALTTLSNAISAAPDVPLSPAARYLQALCYDVLGDRQSSRVIYFDLWVSHPDTLWGPLAGAHLELR